MPIPLLLSETVPEIVPLVMAVKVEPLLTCPPTVTVTGPVLMPLGAVAPIDVALQLKGVAVVPLNFTVAAPCGIPKPEPVMVVSVFTGPLVGEMPVIEGGGITVKLTEFDAPA